VQFCCVMYVIVMFCRAAFGGHANVCQMLLKYGIDPNICDLAGYSSN
jgi:ankyrin repeat protein